jgi:hypothetical protein
MYNPLVVEPGSPLVGSILLDWGLGTEFPGVGKILAHGIAVKRVIQPLNGVRLKRMTMSVKCVY